MDVIAYNRNAWNREAEGGSAWSIPVDADTIAAARTGDWSVVLTPLRAVPRDWFGDVAGRDVLCLASGGGQQAPVLAAAGATVTSFDLSDAQLDRDRTLAQAHGLPLRCVQGDMCDLSAFGDGCFDLVFHPVSNVFVPVIRPVWDACHRVLRPGGVLLVGFMNPALFLFDFDESTDSGQLVAKYPAPYAEPGSLDADARVRFERSGRPAEFGHSLQDQIGGQLEAGFMLTGLYEDGWAETAMPFGRYAPVAVATRAIKPV